MSNTTGVFFFIGVGLFIALLIYLCARADDPNDDETTRLARRGDPEAQNSVGLAKFMEREWEDALYWFRKAAKQGHVLAMCNAYNVLAKGPLGRRDYGEANEWLDKAVRGGDPEAMFLRGLQYRDGNGVPADPREAFDWWLKAAEKGHARAMVTVGWAYVEGYGMDANPARAAEWYEKAAERGNPSGMIRLALLCREGLGVRRNPEKAFRLLRGGVAEPDPEDGGSAVLGNYYLAGYYASGEASEKDEPAAVRHWTVAAEAGMAEACRELGLAYRDGRGVEKSAVRANHWLRKAADAGLEEAMRDLEGGA